MYLLLVRLFTLLKLVLTGLVLILSSIGIALFLIYYGVKAGLMDKKIHIYRLLDFDVTGKEAVQNGWFYILMGLIVMAISIRLTVTHFDWIRHLFH
jgi:hypothetical protein